MSTWQEAIEHMGKGGHIQSPAGMTFHFDPVSGALMKSGTDYITQPLYKAFLHNDWTLLPILVSWQEAFRAMIVDGKRAMCAAYNDIVYKFERGQFIANKDCVNCISFDIPSHVKADHKWEILP